MTKHLQNIILTATLVVSALFSTSGTAFAQGNLYYMHNASAYYVWTDYETCKSDHRKSGKDCSLVIDTEICGYHVLGTIATRNVAQDKLKRNQSVVFRHTSSNSKFCTVTP